MCLAILCAQHTETKTPRFCYWQDTRCSR